MTVPSKLVQRLKTAKRVVVLTGAGVSAESGVPTFRAAQTGLWSKFKPEEIATPRAFKRNPRLVWEGYEWRRKPAAGGKLNPPRGGHPPGQTMLPRSVSATQRMGSTLSSGAV